MDTTSLKVLYVEDDAFTRIMIEQAIKSCVKKVITAGNGLEGIEKFEIFNPDIIITDLEMPELNGFGLINFVRNKFSHVPIIVTTAYTERYPNIIGANQVLTKPVKAEDIINSLRSTISVA